MCQVYGIGPSSLGCDRVLLRKHETHDLAELDILQEKLDVNRIRVVVTVWIPFVLDEVVFSNHFDIRIVGVDGDRAA